MKSRLPSSLGFVAIPALCIGLLALAWFLVRDDRDAASEEQPPLSLLAEEGLKPSVDGLVAAFSRRSGVEVALAYQPAAGLEAALGEGASGDLLLLAGEGEPPGPLSGAEPAGAAQGLRAYALPDGAAAEDAARFLEFLGGSFAAEILERQGGGRPLLPPMAEP